MTNGFVWFIWLLSSITIVQSACPHPPPNPLNSKLSEGKIVCDPNFKLFGEEEPKCGKDGVWKLESVCATNISPYTNITTSSSSPGNCKTTKPESSPWWRADLLTPMDVHYIRLQFGGETSPQPDIEIRVGNSTTSAKNPLCAWEGVASNKTYKCARPIIGQFVFIIMVGDGSLSICESQIYSQTDPSACTPPSPSPHILHFNLTCYEMVHANADYTSASIQCTSRSGNLLSHPYPVSLLNQRLQLQKHVLKKQTFFIGVQRDPSYTSRTWRNAVNSAAIPRPLWAKDQPNNYNGLQNCIVLDGGREWAWNDVGCSIEGNFICEFGSKCSSVDRKGGTEVEYFEGGVHYKCAQEGWVVEGGRRRVCDRGKWQGVAPICRYVDCGRLNTTLLNGRVEVNRTTYGATANYTCDSNYTLVGFKARRCREDGGWSGEEPQCLVSSCPIPPNLINGTVTTTGLTPGSISNYNCNHGSILIGSKTSTCVLGGVWNPTPPSCHHVSCNLPRVANGKFVANGTEYGDTGRVHCDEGYWGEEGGLVCGGDGGWEGVEIGCEVVTCPEPPVPLGSYIIGFDLTVNSIIHYHCDPGHYLVGQSARSCLGNGRWSGEEPQCVYVDCGRVPPIVYGQLSYTTSTYLDSIVTYSCAGGYKLKGDEERKCTRDGNWSGGSPSCEETRCPEPPLPPHAILSVTLNDRSAPRSLITSTSRRQTFKINSVIKFRCERGFKLEGATTLTCTENGNWTNDAATTCTFVDCGEPPGVANGKYSIVSNSTTLNSAVIYECDNGYGLKGGEKMTCGEGGKWEGGRVECREITCPPLSEKALVTKYTAGGIATYTCPRGFELVGGERRRCVNGEWDGAEPICRESPCPPLPSIPNSFQNSSHITCTEGYALVGSSLLTCSQGAWVNLPQCVDPSISTVVVIGSAAVGVAILLLLAGLIWHRKRRTKSGENEPCAKEEPMVLFAPPTQHYYDSPNQEHIYEDIGHSAVTINGVAIS